MKEPWYLVNDASDSDERYLKKWTFYTIKKWGSFIKNSQFGLDAAKRASCTGVAGCWLSQVRLGGGHKITDFDSTEEKKKKNSRTEIFRAKKYEIGRAPLVR